MKRALISAATTVAALALTASAALAVPGQMNFTGRLADGNGPVSGAVNIDFAIFDAATGGTMVWEETKSGVSADQGLVYVTLGTDAGNALDASVFTGSEAWLEVTVNGDTMSPRLALLAVPYAVRSDVAASAETLGTLAPGDVALSNHNHNGVYSPTGHNHDTAYAALNHNHSGVYSPVGHNHDTAYAALSHNHSAADITSGTLSTARFSAYSDLGTEGRLDNDNAGDLITQDQGDTRYSLAGHSHGATSVTTAQITNSTANTGVLPHDCSWTVTNCSSSSSCLATCSAGKFVVGGGCYGGSAGELQFSLPYSTSDGSNFSAVNRWNCGWSTTVSNPRTYMLCCRY